MNALFGEQRKGGEGGFGDGRDGVVDRRDAAGKLDNLQTMRQIAIGAQIDAARIVEQAERQRDARGGGEIADVVRASGEGADDPIGIDSKNCR